MAGRRTKATTSAAASSTTSAAAPATAAKADAGDARESSPNLEAAPTLNQIRYPCLTNMDYHAAREGWLDQIHRWLMCIVIVGGASALVDLRPEMKIIGPIIAALAGALDLTFDLSNRARNHAMFRRRYSEILAEARREPGKLSELQCRIDEISGEEEPVFSAQFALSDLRAQEQTYGEILNPCRPGLLYRWFANVFRFPGHNFNEERGSARAVAKSED